MIRLNFFNIKSEIWSNLRILWKVHESLLGMLCKIFRGSPEASSEPSQIPDMERFAKIAAISIFAKSRSMLDKLRTGILVWKQLPWEFRECSGNWALFSFVILNEIFPHKDCRQIFFPILSEFKRTNWLLSPLKTAANHRSSDDFREKEVNKFT